MPPPTDEIVTREAMEILGVTPSTISRLVSAKKLKPSRRLPGKTGALMFWRNDVIHLARERAVKRDGDGEAVA